MWERIEKLMAAKGVKIADIHKATSIPYPSFTDWKKGKCSPKLDKLQKIADYFEVPVDWLISGTDQTLVQSESHNIDTETEELILAIESRPELRAFVGAAKDATPEDVLVALDMLNAMKRKK